MKEKIVKNFTYDGFGFPVKLEKIKMVKIDSEWHPKIDVRKVSDNVIKQLAVQERPLTGHQVKFIRSYFPMSLREFAGKVVHQSHATVSKWEHYGAEPARIDSNTEIMLKLYIIGKVKLKTSKQKSSMFYREYQNLLRIFSSKNSEKSEGSRNSHRKGHAMSI